MLSGRRRREEKRGERDERERETSGAGREREREERARERERREEKKKREERKREEEEGEEMMKRRIASSSASRRRLRGSFSFLGVFLSLLCCCFSLSCMVLTPVDADESSHRYVAGEAVVCGAALRRQRSEKRLFMPGGLGYMRIEIFEIIDLVCRWRRGALEGRQVV